MSSEYRVIVISHTKPVNTWLVRTRKWTLARNPLSSRVLTRENSSCGCVLLAMYRFGISVINLSVGEQRRIFTEPRRVANQISSFFSYSPKCLVLVLFNRNKRGWAIISFYIFLCDIFRVFTLHRRKSHSRLHCWIRVEFTLLVSSSVKLDVFLSVLQSRGASHNDTNETILKKLRQNDVNNVKALALCWKDVETFIPGLHTRTMIQQELQQLRLIWDEEHNTVGESK